MSSQQPGQGNASTARTPTPPLPPGQGQPPTGERLQQQAGQAAEKAQQTAGQLKDQVVEQATSQLDQQKEHAVGGLQGVAHAFRQTGQHLRESDQSTFAGYAEQAAERLENLTGYLSRRDVRQLLSDLENFSRREPALFLGGAFTLGLLGARFLKSSAPPSAPASSGPGEQYRRLGLPVPPSPPRPYGAAGAPAIDRPMPNPMPNPNPMPTGRAGAGSRPETPPTPMPGAGTRPETPRMPTSSPSSTTDRPMPPPTTGAAPVTDRPAPRSGGDAGA